MTYEKCRGVVSIAVDTWVFGNDNTHDLHLHGPWKGPED